MHPEVRRRTAVVEGEAAAVLDQVLDESDPDDPAPHPEGEQEPGDGAAELHTPSIAAAPPVRRPGWGGRRDFAPGALYVLVRVRSPEDRQAIPAGHLRRPGRPALVRAARARRPRGPDPLHESVGPPPGAHVERGRRPPRAAGDPGGPRQRRP